MRDLMKSALTLPLAISLFGVQQLVNALTPSSSTDGGGAAAAFDALSDATESQLDGWIEQCVELGGAARRTIGSMAAAWPPPLDAEAALRLALDPRLASLLHAVERYGVPALGLLDAGGMSRADRTAALRETANKLVVMQLAGDARRQLGMDDGPEEALDVLIGRALTIRPFERLWAIEELGRDAAARAVARAEAGDVQGLLTAEPLNALPSRCVPMLHVGMGRAFAAHVLSPLDSTSDADAVRHAVTRCAALCRRSSRRSMAGVAFGALGVEVRMTRRSLVSTFDRAIVRIEAALRPYFWHGVGRGAYFGPEHLRPSTNAPRQMIVNLRDDAPDDLAYANALAGIAWATTMVNMTHPEIIEFLLRHHPGLAARHEALAGGIASAVTIRSVTTPDDFNVSAFITHEPSGGRAELWRSAIAIPCQAMLRQIHADQTPESAAADLFLDRRNPA
jgi:hypothetical protein